ncbi:hypothetical protein M9Y10_032593 [Tritrichomonas musculus]|uniref:E3 ubiquitin-protein ligase n=1 Tax=Tritrichomonas musculus TaxID=1915356 RepID=A0ABR2GZS7_9EUKA
MTDEKEEIEILTQQIIKEIDAKPENTIKILESILLGDQQNTLSFDEYLQQLQKTLKKCVCQSSWTNSQLVINCLDCRKTKNACICVNCFLKGNHQGHRITISHPEAASCDCGNPSFWSSSGFCSDHPGPDPHPEQTQLSKDTRVKITSISNAIFSKYPTLIAAKQFLFCKVTDFLTQIVSIGDATQRCVVLAFQNAFAIYDLFDHCYNLREIAANKFITFLGSLMNDQVFRRFYSLSILNDLPKFVKLAHLKAPDFEPDSSFSKIFQFTFHGVTMPITTELIQKSLFEWKTVFIESFKNNYDACFRNVSCDYMSRSMPAEINDRMMTILKSALLYVDKEQSKFIELVDELASYLIQYEFSCSFQRVFGDKYDDPKLAQFAQLMYHHFLYITVYKLTSHDIYTTKPLQLLKSFFDLSVGYFFKIDKLNNNGGFDRDFHFLSVLNENVTLAQSFPTHILAFGCLNLKEKSLIDYVSEVTDDVDTFLKNWAIIPLRWLAALHLSNFGFFVRNSDDAIECLKSFITKKNKKYKFAPTFALLQTLAKSTKNVDDFMMMILSTFGFFNVETNVNKPSSEKLDDNEERLILFTILHFVLCIAFDTFCKERNFFMMRKLCVISELMKGDLDIDEITSIWPVNAASDDQFLDDLKSYASRIKTKNGSKFHLTDNSEWHPLLPFISTSLIIPSIQKFVHDNPDSLISFPKLPKDSQSILLSPILWALQYYILRKKCCRDYPIINQLVFNTLIITSQINPESIVDNNDSDEPIQVKDFSDLANQLKKFTFSQFLRKKVVFFNSNKVKKSMIELVASFGKIGLTVLTRMNVQTDAKISVPMKEEMAKKNRERAKKLKMRIMNNFSKKQKTFQSTALTQMNDEIEEEIEENQQKEKKLEMDCSICHLGSNGSDFVYPALVYKSPLNSYINWRFRNAKLINENDENEANNENLSDCPVSFETVNFVRICLHPIHSECKKNVLSCPTDRCPRNSSIPIIAELYDNESELKQSVFVLALEFIENVYKNDLKTAVFSFASQIEVMEIRHRSNPDCLDDATIQPTLRNIYLCLWHVKRNEASKVLSHASITPLMKYILQSLSFDETQAEKSKIDIENFLNQTVIDDDYKLFQFLRCAAIFDHFARCSKLIEKVDNKIIDWDEILGSSYLCNHYKIPHLLKKFVSDNDVELTLPMISFINLPKNYLDFIHPPFSAPILEYNEDVTILCLLTGRTFNLKKNTRSNELISFIDNQFNGSFDVFLKLNGKNASQLVLLSKEFNARMDVQSFYVDRFGDQDLGMKRGSLLHLNEANEEEIIDMILSGLWTNFSGSWKVANLR